MQIQCPKCGSYKTMSDRAMVAAAGVGLVIFGGLFSVFLFPLVFVAVGVLLLISAAVTKAKKMTCKNCKYKWSL